MPPPAGNAFPTGISRSSSHLRDVFFPGMAATLRNPNRNARLHHGQNRTTPVPASKTIWKPSTTSYRKSRAARAKDIAKRLEVNNSSVTGALRALSEKGFINYAPYDLITLTAKGTELAKDVVRRHEALQDFFVKILQVDREEAEEAACKMEHAISPTILNRLIHFVEFVDVCPRGGAEWLEGFTRHCKLSESGGCQSCIDNCMNQLATRKDIISESVKAPVPLASLEIGNRGRLVAMDESPVVTRQLAEVEAGIASILEVESLDPGVGELGIKVKGYHIAIRIDDAERLFVLPC